MLKVYAECHYAECSYAECRYAEFRYAECRGALTKHSLVLIYLHFKRLHSAPSFKRPLGPITQAFQLGIL
jgi:hypothetical protein